VELPEPTPEQSLLAAARSHVPTFNWLCFRDPKTGKRWDMQAFQEEWERAIAAHDRLVILAPAGHGKSECIARSWVLRQLAADPNRCGAILSNTDSQASRRLSVVAEDVKTNAAYRAVYPQVRPETRKGRWQMWAQDKGFILQRDYSSQTPSLQSCGIGGALLGSRLDWGVVDDPNDEENMSTAAQREKALHWLVSTFITRFDGRGKIVVIQTSWHEDDIGHKLVKDRGFHLLRYEACDEAYGHILWPGKFTAAILRQIEIDLQPTEFARTMRNLIRSDTFNRIQWALIKGALERGRGVGCGVRPPGCLFVVTGVDPASGKKLTRRKSDLWGLVTIAVFANGDRQVLEVDSGRWQLPDAVARIKANWATYEGLIAVENNGVQEWLKQQLGAETAIPVVTAPTTAAKWDPATGVESVAIELAAGKWIIPSDDQARPATEEIRLWCAEMQSFQLGTHTGDRLMASYVARNQIRTEEARQARAATAIVLDGEGLSGASPWEM
jgi:hypothetical protein